MDTTAIDGLAIVAMAHGDEPFIAKLLTAITEVEVSLQQCHTHNYDEMTIFSFHVLGHWHALSKLEDSLPKLAKKHNFLLFLHRSATETPIFEQRLSKIPYTVEWANLASAEVTLAFYDFFAGLNIEVYDIHLQNIYTNPLGIGVAVSTMRILLPMELDATDFREQFSLLCESMGIDAYLEPDHR